MTENSSKRLSKTSKTRPNASYSKTSLTRKRRVGTTSSKHFSHFTHFLLTLYPPGLLPMVMITTLEMDAGAKWKTGKDRIHESPPDNQLHIAVHGGEHVINLAGECMKWGVITHEVLHALRQVHEHNRLSI